MLDEIGIAFVARLYGGDKSLSLNSLRFVLFNSNKAAIQHAKRARLQVMTWRAADQTEPPRMDLSKFGWKMVDNILVPEYGSSSVAPPRILKLVACGCKSDTPCSRGNCSCRLASLSCTTYCHCKADDKCMNPSTIHTSDVILDDHDEENVDPIS